MMTDYEIYEKKCTEMRNINRTHLENFDKWLQDKGLVKKTIDHHVANVDFYINDFLCYYDVQDLTNGCHKISDFLGDWFIRKTSWASCASIKSNAASFKKFYSCMLENGVITQTDYDLLCKTIKNEMSDWIDEVKRYEAMDDSDFFDI